MKNALKYLSLLTLLLVAFTALASCGGGGNNTDTTVNPTSIAVSASTENVLPGQSALLQKTTTPADANATITWKINEGASYAGISGDVLVVNPDTPTGTTIKVQAVCGTVVSNELTFTVGYPITGIVASAIGSTTVSRGGTGALNAFITPSNATSGYTWVIVEGSNYATIAANSSMIVINNDVPLGTTIKVKAVSGEIESNEVVFTVGQAVESITASIVGSSEIVKGQMGALNATVSPADATVSVEWVFVEGENYAAITGNMLLINSNAPTGASIKVKAVAEGIESNVLTFTVLATQDEIDASSYFISLSGDSFTVDKKGSSAPTLSAEIYNRKGELITHLPISMTVTNGAEFLSLTQNGFDCYFTALGHGEATVEVRIVGTDIVETADVKVIVPPEAVKLPEVFAERTQLRDGYAFSMVDSLPFVPSVLGDGACTDLVFDFVHASGAIGDEVAVYENGAITFKKTGKVTLTVSSASGSKVEAKVTYTFNINDGYNVYTFEQLRSLVLSADYKGQQINFVVLEKPNGSATGYTYGYELVPATALKAQSEQTIGEILDSYIYINNKSVYLNGNNHTINASQLAIFNYADYLAYCEKSNANPAWPYVYSLIYVGAETSGGVHKLNFYNIELVGNCPIDYDKSLYGNTSVSRVIGTCFKGLTVGTYGISSKYYIDADNLTASAFDTGFSFMGIVGNGKVSNVYAYNIYNTGIAARSSIMTFENLKFGPCGATGIELAPEDCNAAGLNDNELAHITISGTVDAKQNVNSGNTNYFNNYNIGGATVPQIITGNILEIHAAYGGSVGLGDLAVGHVQNANGEFIFIALLFDDISTLPIKVTPNESKITYPEYLEGGIIDITELPTDGTVDTTHQFIRMTVYAPIPGLGTQKVGSALFYNMHYGK